MDMCGLDLFGCDSLGAEVTVPAVGANYTDAKTVAAVQSELVKRGYDLGTSGPDRNGVDGVLGPKTAAAIKKIQGTLGEDQNGRIDEVVIMALKVTPGTLPPGVTIQGRAAVQAQVALDAATRAEHAKTPQDVQLAAQQAVDAAPAQPPALKQAAQAALDKARSATTPAQVQAAAVAVKQAAEAVHETVKPSWWSEPAWPGAPARWQVSAAASGGLIGIGAILWAVLRKGG